MLDESQFIPREVYREALSQIAEAHAILLELMVTYDEPCEYCGSRSQGGYDIIHEEECIKERARRWLRG